MVGRWQAVQARWRAVDRLWLEWLPVAGLLLLSQVELVSGAVPPDAPTVWAGVLTVLMILPLGWRRSAPLPVLTAVMAAIVVHALVIGPLLSFGTFLAAMLAVYTVAAHRDGWQPTVAAVITAVAVTTVAALDPAPADPFEWIFPLVYFGGAWGLGRVARSRRQRAAELQERVAQADHERQQQVRLAAAEERARIARELHDVVAHSIGLMVVQAEAAEEMLAHDPAEVAAPLAHVQSVGRQALTELRQLLGAMRADVDGTELRPTPGLADLPALVAQLQDTGMHVDLTIEGRRRPLAPGLELSAYRIIQEALTNSRKHGGVSSADVEVRYLPAALQLRVSDRGRGASPTPTTGHGLVGMRERVALYGGVLDTGPQPAGGYAVAVTLPLEPT